LKILRKIGPAWGAALVLAVAGCGGSLAVAGADSAGDILSQIDGRSNSTRPFVPAWPSPEFKNYTAAQRLYANPNTIVWCTTTWGNASSPLVTIPIAGKLTSSSVSFFPSTRAWRGDHNIDHPEYTPERRSVDGMYHGSPPPYRYGFTPGGQYVDFFNMPTLCTTALTRFQRQTTKVAVTVDEQAKAADQAAEAALARGDRAGAQRALNALDSDK
jgi:hypothetical protein